LGRTFDWLSSAESDFNHDHAVSFTPAEIKSGDMVYNFGTSGFRRRGSTRHQRVFYRDEAANIFHTYARFARAST
jgi:predicted dithiol-disulfide oxidoreductase (DUF899 family)